MSMDHSPMCSVDQPCRGARIARLRALLAASCIGVAVAGSAIAGPFEDGAAAYQRGDYEAAYLRWHSIAELGDRNAQYNIARLYYQGKGVPQDFGEAARWYRRAASRGELYAQFFLGVMFASGKGVPQDYSAAAFWYRKSADQGAPEAQANLGALYHSGQGVPQDPVAAYKWYDLAVSRFTAADAKNRDEIIKRRDEMASHMTPEEIAEAQKNVREWKPVITEP
jgi:TPR repeat protein